MGSVVEDFK